MLRILLLAALAAAPAAVAASPSAGRPHEATMAMGAFGHGREFVKGAPGCKQVSDELAISMSIMETVQPGNQAQLILGNYNYDRANQRVYQTFNITQGNGTAMEIFQWIVKDSDGDFKQTTVVAGALGVCYSKLVAQPDWLRPISIGAGGNLTRTNVASTEVDVREFNTGTQGLVFVSQHRDCMPVAMIGWNYVVGSGLALQHGLYFGQGTSVDPSLFAAIPSHCIPTTEAPSVVHRALRRTAAHARTAATQSMQH